MTKQMSMLEDIDRYSRVTKQRNVARIQDKLEKGYHKVKINGPDMDRLIVIYPVELFEIEGYTTHYYRCAIGYHRTVGGQAMHVISMPNEEWPDVPRWQLDRDNGMKWTYPMRDMWASNEEELADVETSF